MTDNANVMEKNADITANSDANSIADNVTAPVDQTSSTDNITMAAATDNVDSENVVDTDTTSDDKVVVIGTKPAVLSEKEKKEIDNMFESSSEDNQVESSPEDNQDDSTKSPKNNDNNTKSTESKDNTENTRNKDNSESTKTIKNTKSSDTPVVDLVEDDTLAVSQLSSRHHLSRSTKTYMSVGAHVKLIVEQKDFRRVQT